MKLQHLLDESSQDKVLELRDVVKFFPNTYARVIRAKWGSKQLTYRGMPFFVPDEDTSTRTVYDEVDAAEEYIRANVSVPVSYTPSKNDLGFEEMDADLNVADAREVYLGYDAQHNQLLIGFDLWLDEESFNQEFEKSFREQTGEEFDNDDPDHEAVFQSIWDQHKNAFAGGLFRLVPKGRGFEVEEEYVMGGGFYKGIYRQDFFKRMDLIDLRLD